MSYKRVSSSKTGRKKKSSTQTITKKKQAIDVKGNWKTFESLSPTDYVLLYHATSRTNAESILKEGYNPKQKVWRDSDINFIYMGAKESLGTYVAQHLDGVYLVIKVLKGDLLPDLSGDWDYFKRTNKDFIKIHNIDIKYPDANTTFKTIAQVKAHKSKIFPLRIEEQ